MCAHHSHLVVRELNVLLCLDYKGVAVAGEVSSELLASHLPDQVVGVVLPVLDSREFRAGRRCIVVHLVKIEDLGRNIAPRIVRVLHRAVFILQRREWDVGVSHSALAWTHPGVDSRVQLLSGPGPSNPPDFTAWIGDCPPQTGSNELSSNLKPS